MRLALRWWGPADAGLVVHSFETLVDGRGATLIRTGELAACGWRPPGGVLESPEETDGRACPRCIDAAYRRPCAACDGAGRLEVCAMGHGSGNCPCPTRRRSCEACDGNGRESLSDDEIEALESGRRAVTG